MIYFYSLVFFISFFRIPFPFTSLYLSAVIGLFSILLFRKKRFHYLFFNSLGFPLILLSGLLFIFSISVDLVTGSLVNNFSNTFSLRVLMIYIMSALPAGFIVWYFTKGDLTRLINVVFLGFLLQSVFWFFTFFFSRWKRSCLFFGGYVWKCKYI